MSDTLNQLDIQHLIQFILLNHYAQQRLAGAQRRVARDSLHLVHISSPLDAATTTLDRHAPSSGRAAVAAPAFPSKAELEAELAAEQAAAAAAAAASATASDHAPNANNRRGSAIAAENGNSSVAGAAHSNASGGHGAASGGSTGAGTDDSGPSELTLVAYSAFMGLSSLLFGGLTLLQAKNAATDEPVDPTKPLTVREILLQGLQIVMTRIQDNIIRVVKLLLSVDPQTLITGILVLSIVFVIAHTTRPSDESFRSYLTDLQLHEHLRHIQKRPLPDADASSDSPGTSKSPSTDALQQWSSDERPTQHASTFANRISISIRTPPYMRHDYFLFSLIMVKQPASACQHSPGSANNSSKRSSTTTTTSKCSSCSGSKLVGKASWYVGVFGRWFAGARDVYDSSSLQGNSGKRRGSGSGQDSPEYGVLDMYAGQNTAIHRPSAPKYDSSYDSPAPEETSHSSNNVASKTARRKRNAANRLRPSQISTAMAARSKKAQEDGAKGKPHPTCADHAASHQDGSPAHTADTSDRAQASPLHPTNSAAEAASLTAIEAAIKDYETQVATLKSSTDSSQEQLQAQLDELRQRKRDEDAARLDLRGRTKGLDEGKRQAEAARREAEKRLKTAQGLRDAAKSRIESSQEALRSFVTRQTSSSDWVKSALKEGEEQRQTLTNERQQDEKASAEAEATLAEVQSTIERLEAQLAQEQRNLDVVQQNMQDRMTNKARQMQSAAAMHAAAASHYPYGGVGHGYGAGGGDHLDPWSHGFAGSETPIDYNYFDPRYGSRRGSEDQSAAMMYGGYEPTYQSHGLQSYADGGSRGQAPYLQADNAEYTPQVQTPRQPRSLHDISAAYASGRRKSSIPPTSPFSMDLLPSNLFQNLDDDDARERFLAGSKSSDQIEAALNQFGLDTSDQSDAGGNQSDGDGADSVLDATHLAPLSEHGSEDEGSASTKNRRSWWGSKSRQASKDRPTADVETQSSGADSEVDGQENGNGKRRSFGVWPPRLSLNQLNPGAKSFRSASRKQADTEALRGKQPEGYGSQGYLGRDGPSEDWGAMEVSRSESKVIPTQFDAVRRAFEASNPPDEEEGRRSWSAFDQWSQRQGLVNHGMRFNEANSSSGAVNQVGASSRLGQESFNGWPDDVFQPLSKATSADAGTKSGAEDAALSSSQGSRLNRSRLAFWNQNSKTSVNSSASTTSDPVSQAPPGGSSPPDAAGNNNNGSYANLSLSSQEGAAAGGGGSHDAALLGSSPSSGSTASKPKRGFRWTRKRESTTNSKESTGASSALSISAVQDDAGGGGGDANEEGTEGAGPDGAAAPHGSPVSSAGTG